MSDILYTIGTAREMAPGRFYVTIDIDNEPAFELFGTEEAGVVVTGVHATLQHLNAPSVEFAYTMTPLQIPEYGWAIGYTERDGRHVVLCRVGVRKDAMRLLYALDSSRHPVKLDVADLELYTRALEIATAAHDGQFDKVGDPYIRHCVRVALRLEGRDRVVGLLHDVLEQGRQATGQRYTPAALIDAGIPADLVDVIVLLTRPSGVVYRDYLQHLSVNPMAIRVKLSDLRVNQDISRFDPSLEVNESLLARYAHAENFLLNALEQHEQVT